MSAFVSSWPVRREGSRCAFDASSFASTLRMTVFNPDAGTTRLQMQGIHKRFGATVALNGVDLSVTNGEVLALVGENGAGKSTLMKILSGAHQSDEGHMLLDGEPYAPSGPQDARRRGVTMIYQELALAPHLSVEANVLLGLEEGTFGVLQHGRT